MKASLKFREDQKPLLRAKVPLSILGLPFQSGIVAGESKELTLNLGTFFESGPSIKVSYRPNDSRNPFSLIVKTGTGSFGSPISSSMLMSAEFNLLGGRGNPSFMLHFKPQFGDFSIKKSQSSVFDRIGKLGNGVVAEDDSSIEVVETPVMNAGYIPAIGGFPGKKILGSQPESIAVSAVSAMFSGMEVAARTTVPVRERAVVNLRWGVRVPSEVRSSANPMAQIAFPKIPFLVMNKIGIEHVDGRDSKATTKAGPDMTFLGKPDMMEACFTVKHHLEVLQTENSLLKKAVDDLRQEIAGVKSLSSTKMVESGKFREIDRNGSRYSGGKTERRNNEKKQTEFNGYGGKSGEEDVSEELKKAIMGA